MDERGNVYISNGEGVMAFDPNGNHILKIPTGSGATNNTFAGRDGKTLFITGPTDRVTAIRMSVEVRRIGVAVAIVRRESSGGPCNRSMKKFRLR